MFKKKVISDSVIDIVANTHTDLGKKIAYYWAEYFEKLLSKGGERSQKVCKNYFSINDDQYLSLHPQEQRAVEALYLGLRATTPELIDEVDGIYFGLCEKWPTCRELSTRFQLPSRLGCFMMSLGEMDDPHCTSIAMHDPQGRPVLLHSEQGSFADGSRNSLKLPYPVMFADVVLSGRKFFSCSYPFQLLGSAWAVSPDIAFTGNSIFSHGSRPWKTPSLIPKSYFARKLLDFKNNLEIKEWLEKHVVALPGHFHLIETASNSCSSLMIRPAHRSKKTEYHFKSIDNINYHTNHFHLANWKAHDVIHESNKSGDRDSANWLKDSEDRLTKILSNFKEKATPHEVLDYLKNKERNRGNMPAWVVATSQVTWSADTGFFIISAEAYFKSRLHYLEIQ